MYDVYVIYNNIIIKNNICLTYVELYLIINGHTIMLTRYKSFNNLY